VAMWLASIAVAAMTATTQTAAAGADLALLESQ
jgi:hypothetical protein